MEDNKKTNVVFAAIEPYIQRNIVSPDESVKTGGKFVNWGDGNAYPAYLRRLYDGCTTFHSIVSGCVDYIAGDDVVLNVPIAGSTKYVNRRSETPKDIVRQLAYNAIMFGGISPQVIRANDGGIAEVYNADFGCIRTDRDYASFWYSENWNGRGRVNAVVYPGFLPRATDVPTSILYKRIYGDGIRVYPQPLYAPAVKACEIEMAIDDYHMNSLENGFTASAIVNFNRDAEDEEKREVEKALVEKFAGHQNAGRLVVSWNPGGKENEATIQTLQTTDYGEKYKTLAERVKQEIFTAFRANENLFGIPTANGFNSEEYESAFKLFNRTLIQPVQAAIVDAFDRILGVEGSMSIKPFTLEGAGENIVE